jgi:hypothetical protein
MKTEKWLSIIDNQLKNNLKNKYGTRFSLETDLKFIKK